MLAECLMALSGHLFEGMKATYHPPGLAQRFASAEKHVHMVLAVEARESSNAQDKLERHLFGYMMAVYHPPGIAGEVAANI